MDAEGIRRNKESLLRVMPEIAGYSGDFASVNKRWGAAITAGMIEAGRMDQEAATLFNPLIQDMGSTKEKFRLIQDRLIHAILYEMVKKAVLELSDAAKFAINILKRNLYERTADVGYLATDGDLLAFMRLDADDPGQPEARARMAARLREYQKEYTVYDEIIALDPTGRVRVQLDESCPIEKSSDPLIARTLGMDANASGDKYVETFRATDLRPCARQALIYSQAILDADGRPLGVLCLCFDFEDEMRRICADLAQGGDIAAAIILDERGTVIASARPSVAPVGATLPLSLSTDFSIIRLDGREHLAATRRTDGYQGFHGLTWYGMAVADLERAFAAEAKTASRDGTNQAHLERVSHELDGIQRESDDILADMTLDSLNGQVKAAKFQADGFVEVLRFVGGIGKEIGGMFRDSIAGLQATIVSSLSKGVQFRAFQANNIADRNLYERANDVCWWGLTPLFRSTLAALGPGGLAPAEAQALRENLQYINDLYTPYLRLVLADTDGVVLAVSDPPAGLDERRVDPEAPAGQEFVGRRLPQELLDRALRLGGGGEYCVSAFEPSALYGGRRTFVFATAVRAPDDDRRVVGVLEIVFDAEPQFQAMLRDVLPRDESGEPLPGCFAVFAERSGRVIASTNETYPPGSDIPLPECATALNRGDRAWGVLNLGDRPHLTGCQLSAGYREFKVTDGYDNGMLCLVFVPL